MANKIEISMEKILEQNTRRLNSGPNEGQLVIERNLDYMKKWSDDEISEIFDNQGKLKSRLSNKLNSRETMDRGRIERRRKALPMTANNPGSRVDMVESTRKRTIDALKLIFRDEKFQNSEVKKVPSQIKLARMARDLISEENIRYKFEYCFIEYRLSN